MVLNVLIFICLLLPVYHVKFNSGSNAAPLGLPAPERRIFHTPRPAAVPVPSQVVGLEQGHDADTDLGQRRHNSNEGIPRHLDVTLAVYAKDCVFIAYSML